MSSKLPTLRPAKFERTITRNEYIFIANSYCSYVTIPLFVILLIMFPNNILLFCVFILYVISFSLIYCYFRPVRVVVSEITFLDIKDPILHRKPIYDTSLFDKI